jgi:hypothetical protein
VDAMRTNEAAAPGRASGPVLFARYAFAPNDLGYCGPDDSAAFFSRGVTGDDQGLRALARDFDGAWVHLQLIADAAAISDPLDRAIVEAYWLGGPALDQVRSDHLRPAVREVFRGRCGPLFADLAEALDAGTLPHHSFTVLCLYPWVGMLGDPRRTPQAMRVLDRCRIRSGVVLEVGSDHTVVSSSRLGWDGERLALGPDLTETVRRGIDGVGLSSAMAVGDRVALHWDWVCDVISDEQDAALQRYSGRHIDIVNARLAERRQ